MSESDELVTYVFKWVTSKVEPEKTCERCRNLNGKEWHGQDLFQDEIWDEMHGGIWDLNANHSILHPHCRCKLEVTVEVHLEKVEVIEFTVGGQPTGLLTKLGATLRFPLLSVDIDRLRQQVANLKTEFSELKPSVLEANRLLTMYVALSRKMGIEGPIIDAVAKFQQVRIAAEMTYRSVLLLYMATGPLGIAVGFGGTLLSGLMMADQLQQMRRPQY